jgi:hypothetical protein
MRPLEWLVAPDGQTVLAVYRGAAVLRIYESEMEAVDGRGPRGVRS